MKKREGQYCKITFFFAMEMEKVLPYHLQQNLPK